MTHQLTLHSPTNTIRATLVIEDGERVEIDGVQVWPDATCDECIHHYPRNADWQCELQREPKTCGAKLVGPKPPEELLTRVLIAECEASEPEIETCSYGDAMRASRNDQRVEAKFSWQCAWLEVGFVNGKWFTPGGDVVDPAEATAWRILPEAGDSMHPKPSNGGNGAGGCEVWEGDDES